MFKNRSDSMQFVVFLPELTTLLPDDSICLTTDSSGLEKMYIKTARVLQKDIQIDNLSRWSRQRGQVSNLNTEQKFLCVIRSLSEDGRTCTIPCWPYGHHQNSLKQLHQTFQMKWWTKFYSGTGHAEHSSWREKSANSLDCNFKMSECFQ